MGWDTAIADQAEWLEQRVRQQASRATSKVTHGPRVKAKPLALHLGTNLETNRPIMITQKTLYENNMHISGASGTGKTRLTLHLMSQLLDWPKTSLVIPVAKGDLGRQARDIVLEKGMADRLIWIDGMDYYRGVSVGLDLLRRDGRTISAQAKSIREAIIYGHGQAEGMDQTKQMARILYAALYAALSANLTIVEALRVLLDKDFRQKVLPAVANTEVRQELHSWDDSSIPAHQVSQLLAPSIARLEELVNDEITCAMLGQQVNSIDIPQSMLEGKVIILNLEQNRPLKVDPMRTLGRTFNNLVIDGMGQLVGSGIHTHYIADEGYFFATEDTARALDTMLEAGLQTIIANHYLEQFDQHGGPLVRGSILNNCGIRVIFRLNNVADAKFWAEQVFHHQYDPLKKKYSRMDKRFEPEEAQRVKKTFTKSGGTTWDASTTITKGKGSNASKTHTQGANQNQTHLEGANAGHTHTEGAGEAVVNMSSIADISGSGSMKGKFGGGGSTVSVGTSKNDGTESPIIVHHEGESSSSGKTSAENDFSATVIADANGIVINRTSSDATTQGRNVSDAVTNGTNTADAETTGTNKNISKGLTTSAGGSAGWSESESVEHYIRYKTYYEEVDVQFYSEQEQISMGAQVINRFANRHCVVQLPGGTTLLNKTADVADTQMTDDERESHMLPFYSGLKTVGSVTQEIHDRQAAFQPKAEMGKKGRK